MSPFLPWASGVDRGSGMPACAPGMAARIIAPISGVRSNLAFMVGPLGDSTLPAMNTGGDSSLPSYFIQRSDKGLETRVFPTQHVS
jgi:hypothetical protein